MQIFLNPLAYIAYLAVVAVHFAAPAVPPFWEKILKCANIALHVVLYFLLMLCRSPLDEVVLLYMLSLLLYVASALLWRRIRRMAEREAQGIEKEEKK